MQETPCVVVTQSKSDVFSSLVRRSSRRDLSKTKSSHSFENNEISSSSLWSTKSSRSEKSDALVSPRKNTSVASAILMRRAPSLVFEDVGGVSDQLWNCPPPPPSPQMASTNHHRPQSYTNEPSRAAVAESTLNSLECWDYSVELECLSGPDGMRPLIFAFLDLGLN
jgi:hypothetical protein